MYVLCEEAKSIDVVGRSSASHPSLSPWVSYICIETVLNEYRNIRAACMILVNIGVLSPAANIKPKNILQHFERRLKYRYSTNHVYLHRANAFGFWQLHLHLCYETLKRISNFSELA